MTHVIQAKVLVDSALRVAGVSRPIQKYPSIVQPSNAELGKVSKEDEEMTENS